MVWPSPCTIPYLLDRDLGLAIKPTGARWGQKWGRPTLVPFCPLPYVTLGDLFWHRVARNQPVFGVSLSFPKQRDDLGRFYIFIHGISDPSYIHIPATPWCGFFAPSCGRGRAARLCSSLPVEGSTLATKSSSLHWLHRYTMETLSRCWPETPCKSNTGDIDHSGIGLAPAYHGIVLQAPMNWKKQLT